MAALTLLLVLFAATAVLAPLAERVNVPYPAVLLIFGMLLAPIPGLPLLAVKPNLILPLILPPLLFAAARRTSWRQFLDNRRAIGLLAVALVAVTAFAAGAVLHAVVPGLPLIAAVAIGAAVAPPDPVAATSVARKLNIPRRLRMILEGEGLSNDATALVLYEVAVASALTGAFSPWRAGAALGVSVVVGVLSGLVVALLARWVINRLPAHPAGSAMVLITPFVAYAVADAIHGSGVLAVVTLALSLSRYGDAESAETRLVSVTAWEIIELLVSGAAFAFVGLEMRDIVHHVHGPLKSLLVPALLVTLVVIVIRFVWIFPVASIDEHFHRRKDNVAEPFGWREKTVSSWAGMRGVVTLVTALALPANFPERDRLVFVAFVVVSVTLLLQGLTLPALVKLLRLSVPAGDREAIEQELIRHARDAGMQRLQELREDVGADVVDHVEEGAARLWYSIGLRDEARSAQHRAERTAQEDAVAAAKNSMLSAARDAVLAARSQPGADPTVADEVLRRLDARGTVFE